MNFVASLLAAAILFCAKLADPGAPQRPVLGALRGMWSR
jgi:hypothetical protein